MTEKRRRRPTTTPPPEAAPFLRRWNVWIPILLVALDLVVYARVRNYGFITFDDPAYVIENPHVQGGVTWQALRWALTAGDAANWHPVTWVSHMLDVQWFGLDGGGHHVTSLILHVLNTLLLFWGLSKLTGAPGRSAFVAALFGVHPLHVESVTWVAERKDVLSTLFWWLTTAAYVAYVRRPKATRYALVLVCFALGLASKPMLVTLPFTLLLLDVWPLRRSQLPGRQLWLEKIPLFVLAAASSAITYLVQQKGEAINTFDAVPVALRLANALQSYVLYLAKVVWPFHLAVFYPHPTSVSAWVVLAALAGLVAISVAAVWFRRTRPYLAVGWFWYVGTLVPVIGVIQVGGQAMADRYTYIPLVGIFVVIAWGVPDLLARWSLSRTVTPVAASVVIATCAGIAWRQVGYWRTHSCTGALAPVCESAAHGSGGVDLWQHAIDVTTDNYIAHDALGSLLMGFGRPGDAIGHFSQAVAIKPTFAQAYYNLGTALVDLGQTDDAIGRYEEAIRILPDFGAAHAQLGHIYELKGQLGAAAGEYAAALRTNPDLARAHEGLGGVLMRQGKTNEALVHLQAVTRLEPTSADAHYRLATALAMAGQAPAAIDGFSEALRLEPGLAEAWNARGSLFLQAGRVDDALSDFLQAVGLNPDYEAAHFNIGVACRASGRKDDAITAFREVLRINPQNAAARRALAELMKQG